MPLKIAVTMIAPDLPDWAYQEVDTIFHAGDEEKAMFFLASWIEDQTIISTKFELTEVDETEVAGA